MHMHRPLPEGAKPIGLTFTRIARRWFVTIMVAVDAATEHSKPETACGVDVGVNWLAMVSDGTAFENIRPRSRRTNELRAAKRALSRCQKDSRRRGKIRNRLARAERRVFDERSTHLHQVSAAIVRDHATVVVEDLALRSMTRAARHRDGAENPAAIRGRNRAMADAAPGRLIEMIRYKAEKAGGRMIKVDPRHTSQACHACGVMVPKAASTQQHLCDCGADMHRDHNAALNILARGMAAYAAATGRGVGKASANARLRPARSPRNAATAA